jgi:RimJ/RimL family protein N-acetyltransferase
MPPRDLTTPRLRLNAVLPSDVDEVFAFCNDPELQAFVPVPVPYTREVAEGYVTSYATAAPMLWAIRETDDGPLLGVVELIPSELASAELGYWLGGPHRGRRIMSEAAEAVIEFGFARDGGNLDRISWCAVVGNNGSARIARALGFRYEGMRRRALAHRERLDGWFASLLRDDDRDDQAARLAWPV